MSKAEKAQFQRIMSGDRNNLTNKDVEAINAAGGIEQWLKQNNINVTLSQE
jgi:hypothetical protein